MKYQKKAYPVPNDEGADLRDIFAGQILASAMASASDLANNTKEQRAQVFDLAAEISYEAADALIRARNK